MAEWADDSGRDTRGTQSSTWCEWHLSSWAELRLESRLHHEADSSHIARILNLDTPRPGSTYRIDVTNGFDDKITVEATFPGGFNLGQGAIIPGVDFQIWPMFQALDLDVILTCIEVSVCAGAIVYRSRMLGGGRDGGWRRLLKLIPGGDVQLGPGDPVLEALDDARHMRAVAVPYSGDAQLEGPAHANLTRGGPVG